MLPLLASPAIATTTRVAILPFEINAERDMTFLKEGIVDMLASRIAWKDNVEVINENQTKAAMAEVGGVDGESKALAVGEKLQADYVLFGSLTVFGESVSIDAKMADVSGRQPPLPFYTQTQGMGSVIPQINQFASNINETVFGRTIAKRSSGAVLVPTVQTPVVQAKPATPVPDSHMHPEKLLQSSGPSETPVPVAGQPYQTPNPAFDSSAPQNAGDDTQTHWKSRRFKALITGIDIADVDNDGRKELVFVTNDLVSIYRIENNRMVKTAEVAKSNKNTFISVDAADINGNGTPELYVNSLAPQRTMVNSFIIEYSKGAYQTISDGDNWFYRTVKTVEKGPMLLGQRQRQGVYSIFKAPVQEMSWQGGELIPGRQVLEGGKTNLMGLAYGDITHTGIGTVAAYSEHDRIRLYRGSNDMIWEDGDRTGGDMLFFNLPSTDPGEPNKQYFPMRIRTTDINRDGKTEVMIAQHEDLARNMTEGFRRFKNAKIESLVWNSLGLVSQWQTQTLSGRISDFAVGDIDNDGMDELVIALVIKEGAMIFTESVSNLIAFDLNVQ